ncbi:hypothetical protein [Halorubrum distributum]|uniref:hypothetical protein n=1 Tax=Halorubrum distributum TaxID=29283 RepID=UPI0012674924|nr:hypothetical protein [Halorubrum distributum]
MIQLLATPEGILTVFIAIFVGGYLHEGSHWFVGRVGGTEPVLITDYLIVPKAVDHGQIETMDPDIIRLSGVSVLLWIPLALFSVAHFILEPSLGTLSIAVAFATVVLMTTESDIVAVRDPEIYRERWLNDEFQAVPAFLPNIP